MAETTPQIFIVDGKHRPIAKAFNALLAFGSLAALTWFVNTQIPPSGLINFTVCLCWVVLVIDFAMKTRNKFTPDEARKWLDENYPNAGDAQ